MKEPTHGKQLYIVAEVSNMAVITDIKTISLLMVSISSQGFGKRFTTWQNITVNA